MNQIKKLLEQIHSAIYHIHGLKTIVRLLIDANVKEGKNSKECS